MKSNTMLKHLGDAAREGARSHQRAKVAGANVRERGWIIANVFMIF